jgi:exopolyphosphatase/guanosine-5'-triphosphate,3'-diphosphate pyrophosphatase
MTAAVIDLGTNTFHLIIAEIGNSIVNVIYKTNSPVKLGEGKINDNIIIPAAFDRGIQTLKDFRQTINKYNVSTVKAIATSAVRSAENGADFVEAARKEAEIEIEVISGDEEAAYIYNAVKATGLIQDLSLVMDIGGGSTEFIICDREQLLWKKSYNIGAARLMQAYFKSDPINFDDQHKILKHLQHVTNDLIEACKLYQPKQLIGSAGAFETFTAMLIKDIEITKVKSAHMDLIAYKKLAEKLIGSSHEERDAMPELVKIRVDMIVMACILTNYVIDHCGITSLSLSTYDLKMGVLYSLAVSES